MSRTGTDRMAVPPSKHGSPVTGVPFCNPGVISGAATGTRLATR